MPKAESIAELPCLTPAERAEIQAKLDELAGDEWQDGGELSDANRRTLDDSIAEYRRSPDAGSSWDEVKTRVQAKLKS